MECLIKRARDYVIGAVLRMLKSQFEAEIDFNKFDRSLSSKIDAVNYLLEG